MGLFSVTRLVTAAAAALLSLNAASGEHIQYKIRNGELVSRAVNVGGWLVSEYWMAFLSPLYEGVPSEIGLAGEYAVMQHLGKTKGAKQFEEHWQTFIVEDDIKQIAAYGLNTVRVPVGFWIINDEDDSDQSALTTSYPSGSLKYLDTLVNDWAKKYDVAVMLSLHAHRGSQNGFDNSAPAKMGTISWGEDPANVQSSFKFATFLANRYKDSPAFLGMNLMNEPRSPIDYTVLKKYYTDVYDTVRADGNDCVLVTSPWLENQGPPTMADFMTCPQYYNVWHEWHIYYKWGWENVDKASMLASAASYNKTKLIPWTGNPMYMGEWSLVTVDEVQLTKKELQGFAQAQVEQYDQQAKAGWAFWTWRHDEETKKNPSGWSMRQLLKENFITVPTAQATRTRDPKCKAVFSHGSNSSSSSGSGSVSAGSAGSPSVELYKPETVKPEDSNGSSPVATTTPAAGSAAASVIVSPSLLAVMAAAASFVSLASPL